MMYPLFDELLAQSTRVAGRHGTSFWAMILAPVGLALAECVRRYVPLLIKKLFGVTDTPDETKK